jgi:hypothetical protein
VGEVDEYHPLWRNYVCHGLWLNSFATDEFPNGFFWSKLPKLSVETSSTKSTLIYKRKNLLWQGSAQNRSMQWKASSYFSVVVSTYKFFLVQSNFCRCFALKLPIYIQVFVWFLNKRRSYWEGNAVALISKVKF